MHERERKTKRKWVFLFLLTLVMSVPQKSLKKRLETGVCGLKSLLSLMAEMSSKTKPHCSAFQ